jgi:DNA uptake protein ComE-like DNA-binding protein
MSNNQSGINQATLEELISISGIGEKRTQKILHKKQEKTQISNMAATLAIEVCDG